MRGDGVRALHDYLSKYGYLPNETLNGQFPAWRPVVGQSPADIETYDLVTQQAVKALQGTAALQPTGYVDDTTLQLLLTPRCGVPEGIVEPDPSNKYALHANSWSGSSVTWWVVNDNGLGAVAVEGAVTAALASWSAQSGLTFTEAASEGTADIVIRFAAFDVGDTALARAYYPTNGDVRINTAYTWSTGGTPSGSYDLQTVLLHEFGHSLGISHSSLSAASLYPFASPNPSQKRQLDVDDGVAVSNKYAGWDQLTGCAKDIGIGGTSVWVVACGLGDTGVYKWNGSSWTADAANGAGVRIDVSPSGVPWVTTASGEIWTRSSGNVASGTWTQRTGCAKDIGIGANGDIWIVGCASGGDGALSKWNGSGFTIDAANGIGRRVTVGPSGIPWVVTADTEIWRRSSNNVASGSWSQLPGLGYDIGLNVGNYAWLVGTDLVGDSYSIHTWNEQSALGDNAPAREEWITTIGGAVALDAAPNGRPWLVDDEGAIWVRDPNP